jgi:hypothetical protein
MGLINKIKKNLWKIWVISWSIIFIIIITFAICTSKEELRIKADTRTITLSIKIGE